MAGPRTIEVELPFPPSVNFVWRMNRKTGRIYVNPKVHTYRRDVGILVNAMRPKPETITGNFAAEIRLNPPVGDLDNRIKATLDAVQQAGLIANDKHCQRLTVEWTDHATAPLGCRLTLQEVA
jgi:crossover junction endodeoxyribonuclease RusA